MLKKVLDPQDTIGPMDDFYPFGLRGRRANGMTPMKKPHMHLEIELFSMKSGAYQRRFGSEVIDYNENELCIFWGVVPHQLLRVTPPGKGFIAYFPIDIFLRWDLPADFVQAILSGTDFRVEQTQEVRRALKELSDRLPPPEAKDRTVSRTDELLIQGNFLIIVESALKQWSSRSSRRDIPTSKHSLNSIIHMIQFIIENYQKPIHAKEVCEHVGLHETYGRNLFKKIVGITIYQFLLNYRLEYAKSYLLHTDRVILDVALDAGFGSVSRFHAAFKQVLNMSPNQYRQQYRCKHDS